MNIDLMKVLCLSLAIFAFSCAGNKVKRVSKVLDEPDYKKDQRLEQNSTPSPANSGMAGSTDLGNHAGESHRQTALKNLYDTTKTRPQITIADNQNVILLDSAFADTTASRTTLR